MPRGGKVGQIDDPIWSTANQSPTDGPDRWSGASALTKVAILVLLIAIPVITIVVRGFDWEALVISTCLVVVVLVILKLPVALSIACGAACMLGTLGLLTWSVDNFHTVNPFAANPPKINYCDREYFGDEPSNQPVPHGLEKVGDTPDGEAIYSRGCDMTLLWVQTGSKTSLIYGLSGGF